MLMFFSPYESSRKKFHFSFVFFRAPRWRSFGFMKVNPLFWSEDGADEKKENGQQRTSKENEKKIEVASFEPIKCTS